MNLGNVLVGTPPHQEWARTDETIHKSTRQRRKRRTVQQRWEAPLQCFPGQIRSIQEVQVDPGPRKQTPEWTRERRRPDKRTNLTFTLGRTKESVGHGPNLTDGTTRTRRESRRLHSGRVKVLSAASRCARLRGGKWPARRSSSRLPWPDARVHVHAPVCRCCCSDIV